MNGKPEAYASGFVGNLNSASPNLDFHYLRFLLLEVLVHLGNELVGELLHFFLSATDVVFRQAVFQ